MGGRSSAGGNKVSANAEKEYKAAKAEANKAMAEGRYKEANAAMKRAKAMENRVSEDVVTGKTAAEREREAKKVALRQKATEANATREKSTTSVTTKNLGVVKIRAKYAKSDRYKQNPIGYRVETSSKKYSETFKTKNQAMNFVKEQDRLRNTSKKK